jgi:SnoaL-like domain
MDVEIRAFLDKAQIREVLHAYCRAADRGDEALLRSIYHEGAREEHGIFNGTSEGYIDYVMAFVDKAGVSAHNITTCNIDLQRDAATAESYFFAVHCDIPLPEGTITDLTLGGRYLDRFERRAGGSWKIAHRRVIYDWNNIQRFASRWDGPFFETWRPRGRVGPADESFVFFKQYSPEADRPGNSNFVRGSQRKG